MTILYFLRGLVLLENFSKIDLLFNSIKNKKVAFIGAGVSHFDLIKMFLKKGINVTVCDKKDVEGFGSDKYEELKKLGANFSLGENYFEGVYNSNITFRTPGMYFLNPLFDKARENGVVITSEMEVFFDLCPCKIYAVTGSDGKTTTTTLISEILKKSGKTVHLGGNIGRALLPIIDTISSDDVAVVELSSFQLISMRKSPDVAVVTNVSPNHLDVHKDMAEYIGTKKNLLLHQNAFSRTVLNNEDETTADFKNAVRGELFTFSKTNPVKKGGFLREDGMICFIENGVTTEIMHKNEIKIPGMHNVENFITAITAIWGNASIEDIVFVANNFGGVEHRIEFVCEKDGVRYYNDSIATSPTRVIAGLNAFTQKIILIAGGYDKNIPFEPLGEPINKNVKAMILLGKTADKIEKAVVKSEFYDEGTIKIIKANSLEEAVKTASEIAEKGDIVSLSPACASFDLYANFEARGHHFKDIVNGL